MLKRKFTNEFKQEAVELVLEQGQSVSETARGLGIKTTTLHGWLTKARDGILDPKSSRSLESEEIKRLRKELAKVTQEREILKKAAAYFAKISS